MAHESFELILPYIEPIADLVLAEDVSEIMVNPDGRVFVERMGRLQEVPGCVLAADMLLVALENIARILGDDISAEKPILDSRLADGSRVAAVVPPCSVGGPMLTIRKFTARAFTTEDLIRMGTLTEDLVELLASRIRARKNILLSGGTGTGKTTLLNILCDFIPDSDRIVIIEDTAEIQVRKSNVGRLEARRGGNGVSAVTIGDLLKATLRHRPDRIIVGEVRGGEAFDLLQALNTGHSGTISTIHADSARRAVSRLMSCVLLSGVEIPPKAIKAQIAESFNLLVHIDRREGKRYVSHVLEVDGYDPDTDDVALTPLYQHDEVVPIG